MTDFDPYQHWLGIPPSEQPPDHYRLLGLRKFESDLAAIQSATDERMALVRIYQTGPRAVFTQKLLNELASAKLCLVNPFSKAEYDASLPLASTGTGHIADALLPSSVPAPHTDTSAIPSPHARSFPEVRAMHIRRKKVEYDPLFLGWWLPIFGLFAAMVGGLIVWGGRSLLDRRGRGSSDVPAAVSQGNKSQGSADSGSPVTFVASGTASPTGIIVQEASGFVVFPMSAASLQGLVAMGSEGVGEFLVGWESEKDQASWRFRIEKLPSQGIFRVRMEYQAASEAANAEYVLAVDGEEQVKQVRPYGRIVEDELYVSVQGGGEHTLKFFVRNLPANTPFGLKLIEFSVPRADRQSAP